MFMRQSTCFKRSNRRPLEPQNQSHAFTLTELVVVIATIAVLTALVLPALAGAANKGGRAQCANNLRRISVASMIYATEYRDWLPVNLVHSGSSMNHLNGMHYSAFVVMSGMPNTFVPTNANPTIYGLTDLGLVYYAGLAGNGSFFFCPDQWGAVTGGGADVYSPLLTADAGGRVRSSYFFNPRTIDPTNGNVLRLYQKTGDLPPHKLFVVDYFSPGPYGHYRERGWNVLFTDGSVQFSQDNQANNLIQTYFIDETTQSHILGDQICNYLELDH